MSIIRYLLIFLVTVFLSNNLYSQTILKGRIIDSITGSPIPNATLIIDNTFIGTISNEAGEFVLPINDSLINNYCIISCIGYKKKRIKTKIIINNNIVFLNETAIVLPEINVITGSNSFLSNLVHKAVLKKRSSYNEEKYSKCFIKILTTGDNIPIEMVEAFGQATLTSIDGLENIILKTGRIGFSRNIQFINFDFIKTITTFSAFRQNSASIIYPLSISNLNLNKIKKEYLLNEIKTLYYNSENVLEVDCKVKNNKRNFLNTKLLIGLNSKDIYSYTYYGYIKNNSIFIPIENNHKIDSLYIKISLIFKNNPNDSSYLKILKFEYWLNYYDAVKIRKIHSTIFVYFYDYKNRFYIPDISFSKIDNDYEKLLFLPFDKKFWLNNVKLAETKTEEEYKEFFKKNGFFINYKKDEEFNLHKHKIVNPFIVWSFKKPLEWSDINRNSIVNPVIFSSSISYKARHYSKELYKLEINIFFDAFKRKDSLIIYTSTLFSKNTSFYYLERDKDALNFINLYAALKELGRCNIINSILSLNRVSVSSVDSVYQEGLKKTDSIINNFNKEVERGKNINNMKEWFNYVAKNLKMAPNEIIIKKK